MGLSALWEILGDGEITSPAKLATEWYNEHKRPLRVAIDAAGWRYNNLTEAHVAQIRQNQAQKGHYNGEKNIFYRICRLLSLNYQLLFVFDGPNRPHKRGHLAGAVPPEKVQLLKDLLDLMKIPRLEAPSEAEAECANLQENGIVDAIWSEDADALTFGATFLIRDFRVPKGKEGEFGFKTEKHKSLLRVYRGEVLERDFGLKRDGLVLYTMMIGGDYNPGGVSGVGKTGGLKAVKAGIGSALCACKSQREVSQWIRERLQPVFAGTSVKITPYSLVYDDMIKYRFPVVSTVASPNDLKALRHGWVQDVDEPLLRNFLGAMFNIWAKGFLEWIGPIYLIRRIQQGTLDLKDLDLRAVSSMGRGRKKAKLPIDEIEDDEIPQSQLIDAETSYLMKIKFKPTSLTRLQDDGVKPGSWNIKKPEEKPDWDHVIEEEVLRCMFEDLIPTMSEGTPKPSRKAEKESNKEWKKAGTPSTSRKSSNLETPQKAAAPNMTPFQRSSTKHRRTPTVHDTSLPSDDELEKLFNPPPQGHLSRAPKRGKYQSEGIVDLTIEDSD